MATFLSNFARVHPFSIKETSFSCIDSRETLTSSVPIKSRISKLNSTFFSNSSAVFNNKRHDVSKMKKKNCNFTVYAVSVDAGTMTDDKEKINEKEIFACPICHKSLVRTGPSGLMKSALSRSSFQCSSCRKRYFFEDPFLDLTLISGTKEYSEARAAGTELFRSPFVSFAYERGWRQNFSRAGFPGLEEEFEMARRFLEPSKGGVLIDASCGSGLFSRKFALSKDFSAIIALDFSENMLKQADAYIREEPSLGNKNIALVRADIARLPFESQSIDAVHAGAALHCWPSPSLAVAEISRILKPGGIFVATTFLSPRSPIADEYFKPIRKAIRENQNTGMRYWEIDELEELCTFCGLEDYKKDVRFNFIMLSARKPF